MKFVLFDIDGTLIDSGGAGVRALNLSFDDMFSVSDAFRGISMAGKTDLQIVTEGLKLHGIESSNGIVPAFLAAYVKHLSNTIDTQKGRVLAGIREALKALEESDSCILGLLTGNIEQGARIKLAAFDLDRHFAIGAFGDEDEDRNRLLPIAMEKCRDKKRVDIDYRQCIVIGDTPRDVACAKPYGAYAIAVATGPYSYHDLAGTEADAVFQDLSDTDRLLGILGMK